MDEKKFHVGVKALIRNEKGEVLILRTNPKEVGKTYWDIPGGRIKQDDSIEETLKKEIHEELGNNIYVNILKLFDVSISKLEIPIGNENYGLILATYLCELKKKNFTLSSEHTDYKWATVEEAKKLLSVKFSKTFIEKLDELI